MATKISTLKENGDTVYPVTKVECVYNDSNQNVSDLLNARANTDASNLSSTNVSSWKSKLAPTATLLYDGNANVGLHTMADISNYNWIVILTSYNGIYGLTTITRSLLQTFNSSSNRFCLTSDAQYCQLYIPSNTSFYVHEKSTYTNGYKIYGVN